MATKEYKVPMQVHIALATDRTQFLASLTEEQIRDPQYQLVPLLRDLIEDRIKLRAEVHACTEQLRSVQGMVDATVNKWRSLGLVLDGKDAGEGGGA